jgi:hypothetical protein
VFGLKIFPLLKSSTLDQFDTFMFWIPDRVARE